MKKVLKTTEIDKFGRVDEFMGPENGDGESRKLVLVKTLHGGHDYLGIQEGLVDIIGRVFGLV